MTFTVGAAWHGSPGRGRFTGALHTVPNPTTCRRMLEIPTYKIGTTPREVRASARLRWRSRVRQPRHPSRTSRLLHSSRELQLIELASNGLSLGTARPCLNHRVEEPLFFIPFREYSFSCVPVIVLACASSHLCRACLL